MTMYRSVTVGVFVALLSTSSLAQADLCKIILFVHPNGKIDFNGEPLKDQAALDAKLVAYKKNSGDKTQGCAFHIKSLTEPNTGGK